MKKYPRKIFVMRTYGVEISIVILLIYLTNFGLAAKNFENFEKSTPKMQATQAQQCHALKPQNLPTEDKLVLAPIVFQGK